ncbi:TRAP transporter substrate-binding protein DctP [Ectothiorhodospiraceae bacterium WFHF3C12]|nr:TRAP transporter substrate-binding protein DctP [Ectothiorhodospiraceae bacterium WFHF3C12]
MNLRKAIQAAGCALFAAVFAQTAAAEPVKIQMTTTWPTGISLIDSDRHFVETVNQLAGDRLEIDFHPGGTLVPSGQVFDAVSSGSIDASADWPGYWAGYNSAFALLGSFPMMLTAGDYLLWLQQWGGFEAFQKVYGEHDMVYLPYAVLSMESGLRSKEPLKSLKDLEGKRLRMSGRPQGEILQALGAAQVQLPGGEVYQALERGVVAGAEFSSPGVDWGMGFAEVTSHWTVPGWHQPGSVGGVMINKEVWNKLSPELQSVMKIAARETLMWSLAYYEKTALEAVNKFKEAGVEVHKLSDEELERIQQIANEALVEASCDNPLYAEIAYSQVKFLADYADWRELQQPFGFGRNLSSLPDAGKIESCMEE